MPRHMTIFAAMFLAAGVALAQKDYDKAAEKAAEEATLSNREKGLYRKIDWKKDAAEARKAAEAAQKPILVFIVVGENARKNAPDC